MNQIVNLSRLVFARLHEAYGSAHAAIDTPSIFAFDRKLLKVVQLRKLRAFPERSEYFEYDWLYVRFL